MKIIDAPKLRWWTGLQVTCNWCQTKVELEFTDEIKAVTTEKGSMAYYTCPECRSSVLFPHPPVKAQYVAQSPIKS